MATAIGAIAKLVEKGLDFHQNTNNAMDAFWNGSKGRQNFQNQATFISNDFYLLAAIVCENDIRKSKRRAEEYVHDSIR